MKSRKEHIEIIDLIAGYLAGEADKEQIRRVENWISEDEKNRSLFEDLKKTWNNLGKHKVVHEIDVNAEWRTFKQSVVTSTRNKELFKEEKLIFSPTLLRVAAAAILVIAFIFGARNFTGWKYITYATADEPGQVWLPDSTHVNLNVHSKIKYPRKFGKKNRLIQFEGEAFFEVKHDKLRPFNIHAGEVGIEVLGTSFDLRAYKGQSSIEVVVNTGKVSMGSWSDETKHIVLEPGNKGTYLSSKATFLKTINTDLNFLAWKTGKLVFVDEELEHIVEVINQTYHCHIVIKSSGLEKCRLTTTFDQMSLDSVINVLKSTLNLEISRKGDTIIISGEAC